MKRYVVNEIFYSIQGEGMRAGTANVFVRFAGCNMQCRADVQGFDCDTDFADGNRMTAQELLEYALCCQPKPQGRAVIFTGGEPMLQLDWELARAFHDAGFYVAIETNGTVVPDSRLYLYLDWVCCSPKSDVSKFRNDYGAFDEVKIVLPAGREPPEYPTGYAVHYLLSPVFAAKPHRLAEINKESLEWCVWKVKENPRWRLSCQQHKWWGLR
jgi:organic radical activating enzyme